MEHVSVLSSDFKESQVVYYYGPSTEPGVSFSVDYSSDLCPEDVFTIDRDNGDLSLLRTVNFTYDSPVQCVGNSSSLNNSEHYPVLKFYHCFIIRTTPQSSTSLLITIDVLLDTNSISWEFSESVYMASTVGGLSGGLVYTDQSLVAVTSFTHSSTLMRYELQSDGEGRFALQQETVQCTSHAKLVAVTSPNHQDAALHNLTLQALPSHSHSVIFVQATYANYYSPVLISNISTLLIPVDTHRGSIIAKVQFKDKDTGPAGTLRYLITGGDAMLGVNPVTGAVSLLNDIYTDHNVTVLVYDLGQPQFSIESTLMIFIDLFNEYRPSISVASQSNISELAPIGTTVASLVVQDMNSLNVSVSLSCVTCSQVFQLKVSDIATNVTGHQVKYDIVLSQTLNYEQRQSYDLVIFATDGELSAQKTLAINVLNDNEPPFFTHLRYSVSVTEGALVGTHLVSITADDEDYDDVLVYSIVAGNSMNSFSIVSQTGLIYTSKKLQPGDSLLNISVTDSEFVVYTTAVITVTSLDTSKPVFSTSIFNSFVYENISDTTPVFSFSAVDADEGCSGAVQYSVLYAEPPYFTIDSVSGLLYVLAPGLLDYEEITSASISIRATSLGEYEDQFSDVMLNLTILNANDNAPVISPINCPCFLTEETSMPQSCHELHSFDRDGNNVEYIFVGNYNSGVFSINPSTGVVSTTSELDHEMHDSYELHIAATDGQFTSEPVKLVIQVLDINDSPPIYSGNIAISVPQDTPTGSAVGSVGASQYDAGFNAITNHVFAAGTPQSVTDVFRIDPLSGQLYLKDEVSSGNSYTFTVRATDVLIPSQESSTTVVVSIEGNKNTTPQFPLGYDRRVVASNLPLQSLVATVSATDSNGDTVMYGLSSNVFDIDTHTGEITLGQALSKGEYRLNVSATDGLSTSYLILEVYVYKPSVIISDVEYTQNAGVAVCSYTGYVTERLTGLVPVVTMQSLQGGQLISYSIFDGEYRNSFVISGNTVSANGTDDNVFTRKKHEAIFITVRAVYGSLFHLCSVTVIINDINDHGPVFESDQYSTEIYNAVPEGSSVFQFQATDPDYADNATSKYTLLTQSVPFQVDAKTGITRLTGSLTQSMYTIRVLAEDDKNSSLNDTTTLIITVLPHTNVPPQFNVKIPTIDIPESQSVGSQVLSLSVADSDIGVQGRLNYCVLGDAAAGYFGVSTDGEIEVISELDYDSLQHSAQYNVSVMVYDASPNPESAQASFIISLKDINDEPPVFRSPVYATSLLEGSTEGTLVITVTAHDADTGDNGVVRYSLSPPDGRFDIGPESGVITTTSTIIDRESLNNDTISLTVVATDQGKSITHSANTTVNIMISDKNDIRPRFLNPSISTVKVSESQTPGIAIFTVEAIDSDYGLNGELRYTIDNNDLFFIDSVSGEIILYRNADFEKDKVSYSLKVSARDLGAILSLKTNSPKTINFEITDVNEYYPSFSHTVYNCSVSEDTNSLAVDSITFPNEPCKVNASDSDGTGNTISYSIEGDVASLFNIDESTGIITLVTKELDYETTPHYILVVTATDSGTPQLSSKAIVLVNITDSNDETPKPDPFDTIWVPEALPPNTVLFSAQATDKDLEDGTLTYSLLSEVEVFDINPNTGDILLENYLYYSAGKSQYSIKVQASDAEGKSVSKTYSLNVLPINNNPSPPQFTASNPLIVAVPLSTAVGTVVVSLDTVDPEKRDDNFIEYYMIGSNHFSVNKTKGDVFVSDSLVSLNGQTVTASVLAMDSGYPSLFSIYNLTILITSDPGARPIFSRPEYHMTVSESESGEDHIVGHVMALVNNRYSNDVVYNISEQQNLPFVINSTTGAVSVSGSLDREVTPTYSFTVQAYRLSLNTTRSVAIVFITVTDINDFLPLFPSSFSQVAILSSFPVNETIYKVFVIDKDDGVNALSTFTLTQTDSPFSIEATTGEVTLTTTPTSKEYNLTVVATNPPLQQRQFDIVVMVVDPAASTIACSNQTVSVPEDTPLGSIIHTLDTSAGMPLFYWLSHDSFVVHPSTGKVFLSWPLDREKQDLYNMLVEVWDGVSDSRANCSLTVVVSDVNDNKPVFDNFTYQFEVVENSPVGHLVGVLSTTDNDLDESLAFNIEEWLYPDTEHLFTLNSSGHLLVSSVIDREKLPQDVVFIVSVVDQDGKRGFANIAVEILDENDQRPMFIHSLPDITLSENVSFGTVVMRVAAFDSDKDSSIGYKLLNSESVPFIIHNTSGIITTSGIVDYEAATSYHLQIIAMDTKDWSLNDTVNLSISIFNEIDTHPTLVNISGPVSVPENTSPGSFVTVVSAVDHPHAIVYTLKDDYGHFSIEAFSGVVRVTRPLDYEEESLHLLTVIGSFNDEFYSEITVFVSVLDENDHSPEITSANQSFVIAESASVSTETVFDLGFKDLDSAGSSGIVYEVLILDPDSENVFHINTTGRGTLKQPLDREKKESYFFQIFVSDGGAPPRYLQSTVSIIVADSNDNPPKFDRELYHFIVSAPVLINEELFQVTASDKDKQQSTDISYTLATETSTFEVDKNTGIFSIVNNLNLDQFYNLTVSATDQGGLSTSVIVTVEIKYCNFNLLSFQPSQYTVLVPEDTPVGSRILSPGLNNFNQPGSFFFYFSVTNEHFSMNSSTGELFVLKQLDFESTHTVDLVLQVNDTDSLSRRIAEATVTVVVLDVNDNHPSFTGTPYAVFIKDNEEVGSVVFTVTAADEDEGVNSELSYSILSQDDHFTINQTTGVVFLSSSLAEFSHGAKIYVVVAASDRGENNSLMTNVTLVVTVLNSNAPNFSEAIYTTAVPESTSVSAAVLSVQSFSANPSAQLFYSIVDTNDVKFPFSIDPSSGEITVNDRGLDRETTAFYSFFVRAEDTTSGLSTQVEVQVTVEDVNDEAPEFSKPLYIASVNEDIIINTLVLNVSATDDDTEPYAKVTFYLESSNVPFRIDFLTGTVYSTMALDYEEVSSYEFKVVANDSGSVPLQGSATIRIILNNINDNAPMIQAASGTLTVSEFPSPSTLVTLISATDPDGDNIEYLLEATEGSNNFKISDDGLLQVSDQEDIVLTEPSYTLLVKASDGMFTVNTTITVEVVDINDHSPVFSQETYYANVTENSPAGVYVANVSATDGDRGSNAEIEYSVNLDQFTVDASTGVITTSKTAIDREKTPTLSLIVIARDGGDRTDTATVVISVMDLNDNPPQFTQSSYVVFTPEESTDGTSVLTVTALDPDKGLNGTVSYELLANSTVPFIINSETGLVTVLGDIDFEERANWSFNVIATDGGGLQSTVSMVTINLINIADANPQFSHARYNLSVPEYTDFGTSIFPPNVTFPDPCDTVEFSVFQKNVPFSIDTDTGQIRVAGSLIRLTKDHYFFNIIVTCSIINIEELKVDHFSDTAGVDVTITDVNDKPSIKSIFHERVSEAAPVNTTVIILEGSDSDLGENGTLRYSISGGDPFQIDPINGALMTANVLDREREDSYVLIVKVSDLGSPPLSDTAKVFVTVTDENDSPPEFLCENGTQQCVYNVSVQEDTPIGEPIVSLSINDADSTGTISFKVTTSVFSVNASYNADDEVTGGVVRTLQELDRETRDWYTFEVVASDGIQTTTATVLINITDVNDKNPVFVNESYEVSIEENYPPNIAFLSIEATDGDEGVNAEISYSLLSVPLLNNLSINSTTGQLFFIESPDREVSQRIELFAQASDPGGRSDTVTIAIDIIDQNDNAPVFSKAFYTASIYENTLPGTDVRYVTATDEDNEENARVQYYLSKGSEEYFNISSATGLITSKFPLDRETFDIINITVIAKDSGTPLALSSYAKVTISVLDVNDNAPVFNKPNYLASVPESADVGTVVLTIYASDVDKGPNAELSFFLTGPNHDHFALVSSDNNATISVAKLLNHESIPDFQLMLQAVDNGIPSMATTVNLSIHVSDENDNLPEFKILKYSVKVLENATVGSLVLTVSAEDLDSSDANLTYAILGENTNFAIGLTSGEIRVSVPLDYETTQIYTLNVTATERQANPRTAQTQVEITVVDINDNPPEFLCGLKPCPLRTFSIKENQPEQVLGNFSIRDIDSVTNLNAVSFSITSGSEDINGQLLFSIDPLSGKLSTLVPLDREQQDTHHLTITANDNGSPALVGSSYVTVLVEDVNDNAPVGVNQSVYLYLQNGKLEQNSPGGVAVNDNDIVNAHNYTQITRHNSIRVSSNGVMTVDSFTVSIGSHTVEVGIYDTLYNGTVTYTATMVTFEIRNITAETIQNSINMLLVGISPDIFVDSHFVQFTKAVMSHLNSTSIGIAADVLVFSIISSSEYSSNYTELYLAAGEPTRNSSYLHKHLLLYLLRISRKAIEREANVNIVTEQIGYCSQEPCSNNGLCSADNHHYLNQPALNKGTSTVYVGLGTHRVIKCSCYGEKSGETCSENKASCDQFACGENGQCIDLPDITGCQCDQGYMGESCDVPSMSRDLCDSSPCKNGASCSSNHAGFTCTCQAGFTGMLCNDEDDPSLGACHINPCLHGGLCVWSDNSNTSYSCSCPQGYTGNHCQVNLYLDSFACSSECQGCVYSMYDAYCVATPTSCQDLSCPPNASCIEIGSSAVCKDECSPSPCLHGGECVRQAPTGYYCMCSHGFEGPNCELTTVTLSENSLILVSPLGRSGEISLEFISEDSDGILLFAGRADDSRLDHMLLYIQGGYVRCEVSLGGGGDPLHFAFNEFPVDDGNWYTISLYYNIQVSECMHLNIFEIGACMSVS